MILKLGYGHKPQQTPNGLFRSAVPFQQPKQPVSKKTQSFIDFIALNVSRTDAALPLQQAFVLKQANNEVRLLMLIGWWRALTDGAAAFIQTGDVESLAL